MSDFSKSINYVLENEGGDKFTNDPDDHGGPTKFGITLETLSKWRQATISAEDVQNMTRDEAAQIYKAFFWLPMGCNLIEDQDIATAIFDTSVPNGTVRAANLIQKALKAPETGHLSKEIWDAINHMERRLFLSKLIVELQTRYVRIVIKDPAQIKFLNGWLARSQKLMKLMI